MIGESVGNCTQRPESVEYREVVASSPARTVVYVVLQGTGVG
jgi:hypothetical protein